MKVVVIFQERKFIVVVPHDGTVNDLKTEIERVYNALFPSPRPPQSVREIQTVTGCVLYGGYTVSSVLSDNDIIVAVTESTSADPLNHSMSKLPSGSSYMLPYYGVSPMGYTPMLTPRPVNPSYISPQKHYTPNQYTALSHLGTSMIGSVQPPVVRTVGSQCPSPTGSSENTLHSHPPQIHSQSGVVEESEAPLVLGNHHSQTLVVDIPSQSNVSKQGDGGESEPTLVNSTKRRLTLGTQSGSSSVKKKGTMVEHARRDLRGSGSDTHTSSSTSKRKLITGSNSLSPGVTVEVDNQSDSHLSQESNSATDHPRPDLAAQMSSQRKRKLSVSDVSDSKRAKSGVMGKIVKNVTKKQARKNETDISLPDEDSSDWTSSDDSNSDLGGKKTTNKSKSVNVAAIKTKVTPSSVDDSTSEWESASENESKPHPASSTSVDESQAMDTKSDAQKRAKHESLQKSASKVQPLEKRKKVPETNVSASSSEWSSDEETTEKQTPSVSKKVLSSQPQIKHPTTGRTVASHSDSNAADQEKTVEDVTSSKSDENVVQAVERNSRNGDQEEEDKDFRETESHSDCSGSQASQVLKSCSQDGVVSSPKSRAYTASDGRRIKRKRKPNISQRARKVVIPGSQRGDVPDNKTNRHSDNDNGDTRNGEILAHNSISSDEGITKVLSQSQDDVTVIQETQETRNSSHSPSPEIPFLGNLHPLTSSSNPPQKVLDDVTLHHDSDRSTRVSGVHKHSPGDVGDDKEDRESDCQIVREHTNSTGVSEQRKHSGGKLGRLKSNKTGTIDKSYSVESCSDATVSGSQLSNSTATRSRKTKKIHHSKSEKSDHGKSVSCDDSDVTLVGREQGKEKRRKKAEKCTEDLCDTTIIPSSQTDASDGNMDGSDSENTEEQEVPQGVKSESAVSQKSNNEQSSQLGTESSASTMSDSQHKRKSKHKKSKKHKSKPLTIISDEVNKEENVVEMSSSTASSMSVVAVKSMDTTQSDGQQHSQEDGQATDKDTTDVNSDSSQTLTQSSPTKTNRHKKKKKQNRERITLPHQQHSPVISKETTGGLSPSHTDGQISQSKSQNKPVQGLPATDPSQEDEQSGDDESNATVHTPTNTARNSLPRTSSQRSNDGFLKPLATPPKKSVKSKILQLSPAANPDDGSQRTVENRQQHRSERNNKAKGNSLLSVFSVTETELSSDDECVESSQKRLSNDKKKPHRFNFLSSLGSHGKKIKPARQSLPFSRSTHLTPSSRFSSETAMKMFSLTHTSRSATAARRAKLHSTPTLPKPSPSKQKNLGPFLDDLLKETSGKGGEGREGDGEPSLSELLADGSLWNT